MSYSYSESITLVAIECANCAVAFAIPERMQEARRKDHANFYCPNGHPNHYPQKNEAEQYKAQLEKEQREAASLRERAIGAERAKKKVERALDRLKKRSAAGVCPCCNRTFEQLAEHMKSKHKEFRELSGLAPAKQLTTGTTRKVQ